MLDIGDLINQMMISRYNKLILMTLQTDQTHTYSLLVSQIKDFIEHQIKFIPVIKNQKINETLLCAVEEIDLALTNLQLAQLFNLDNSYQQDRLKAVYVAVIFYRFFIKIIELF